MSHPLLARRAELIQRLRDGSVEAWESLYGRYLPIVWRFVYFQLRGHLHEAEDLVGDVFLAAVRQIRVNGSVEERFGPWLVGIARHKVADYWRGRKKHQRSSTIPDVPDEDQDNPTDSLMAIERKAQVVRAMTELDDEERFVLEWKYLDGLSVRQIAERLGRTEKAAESILYRSRKAFRQAYESQ